MPDLRILHIADVHLGGSGPAFGARVEEHQRRLQDAFARCIEAALIHRVQAVLIVGDLFESPRPSERTHSAALQQLRRLAAVAPPIPCFILPGTHDCLDKTGVYRRPEWSSEPLQVWTNPEPATFHLPDGSLALHANPQLCGLADHRPLAGLRPDPAARYNVALAHGSVLIPGVTDADSVHITPREIAASGMDYIALGHWHGFSDQSSAGVPAAYSGSPEIIAIDQDAGGALLVTLSDSGARYELLQTRALRRDTLQLEAEDCPDEASVEAAIRARADAELLLTVTIRGLSPEAFTCDPARLHDELEGGFFRLRIADESVPPMDEGRGDGVAEHLVAARAIAMLRERIADAAAAGDARAERIARRALQLATALLQGKEVLG